MTGSTAVDIVIGLVFVYLLYSLLATLIQEIIATNLSFRSKVLEKAIIRMLNDNTEDDKTNPFAKRLGSIWCLLFKRKNVDLKAGSLAELFYKSPLIKYLGQDSWQSKPAYLSASNFSKTIIDLLRGENVKAGADFRLLIEKTLVDGIKTKIKDPEDKAKTKEIEVNVIEDETKTFLNSLWADAQGDIEKFKSLLEKWFDDTMERASGWYKQYTQLVLLFVGMGVSIFFNVDTLQIIDKLSSNPKLTAQVVQQADNFVKAHPHLDVELSEMNAKDSVDLIKHRDNLFSKADSLMTGDIKSISKLLGMGWQTKGCGSGWLWLGWSPRGSTHWFFSLLGWVLTAFAISLGAPFWFDLLNKLMKLRSSVATTTASTDDNSKTADKAKVINPKG